MVEAKQALGHGLGLLLGSGIVLKQGLKLGFLSGLQVRGRDLDWR